MALGVKTRRHSLLHVTPALSTASALALSNQRLIQLNYLLATHAIGNIKGLTHLPSVNIRLRILQTLDVSLLHFRHCN